MCQAAYRLDYQERPSGFAVVDPDHIGTHLEKVEHVSQELTVYNISVAEDESYVTVGGTVHNCTMALRHLREINLAIRREERHFLEKQMAIYKKPLQPLYPGSQ